MSVVGGQPKTHASPSYKATKHVKRTFLISDYYQYITFSEWTGADELEHATPLCSCHGVFIDQSIFRSNFPGMRLPWE